MSFSSTIGFEAQNAKDCIVWSNRFERKFMQYLNILKAGLLIECRSLLLCIGTCCRRLMMFFRCDHLTVSDNLVAVNGVFQCHLGIKAGILPSANCHSIFRTDYFTSELVFEGLAFSPDGHKRH